jgi:hypothetical protein
VRTIIDQITLPDFDFLALIEAMGTFAFAVSGTAAAA